MSHASTISHYIRVASQGRMLDSDNVAELEDAINGLIEDAVRRAVREAKSVPVEGNPK